MKRTILIADDEKNTRVGLKWALEKKDIEALLATDGEEALKILRENHIDLLIADLKMPKIDGMKLLKICRSEFPDLFVIILTGHGTIETAVDAMKMGAYHYFIKPVNIEELLLLVDRAFIENDLRAENIRLHQEVDEKFGFENIIGKSESMMEVFNKIRLVGPSKASVLIQGESGTGKELIAEAIHHNSSRRNRPLIRLNCGAITPTLLESELFGYEKGAFTGAYARKSGRFELANTGSLFLDEISEMSLDLQVKLLRVLQSQEFERVGGVETIKVDVRIIAATNKNIEQSVNKGQFREDLYYRLNVVRINIPPLRERREDIPLLVNFFLKKFCVENNKEMKEIHPKAMILMQNYSWPGNVRQLQNVIEGLVVMTAGKVITVDYLPDEVKSFESADKNFIKIKPGISLKEAEKELIKMTLQQTNFNRSKTAEILGLGRKTLYRKLEEYKLVNDSQKTASQQEDKQ